MLSPLSQVVLCVGSVLLVTHAATANDKLPATLVEVARFPTELTSFNDLLLTTKGDVLLVQSTLGETEAWDVANQRRLWTHPTDSYAHQLTKDEKEFLWLDQEHEPMAIVRTDLRTGKETQRIPLKIERVKLWNVEFSLEKTPLLVAQARYSDGGYLVTFSLTFGELNSIAKLPKGTDGNVIDIEGLGASPDGERFLLTTRGGLLLVDDQCQVLRRYATANHVSRIRFLPGGEQAIAAGIIFGSPVYLLDLAGGKIEERPEHRYGADSLDISADGKWAVSGGRCRMAAERDYYSRSNKAEGGELVLWNLSAREPVARLNPAFDSLDGVAISADGNWLATAETGDTEGVLVVYQVQKNSQSK